jgi:hypothetical protein
MATGSATTVEQYLAQLPEERREAIAAVREVILKNLDKVFQEGMQYGMVGYFVPHASYPAGYHCDPRQPLPFAGLGNQKAHMSLHLMGLYCGAEGDSPLLVWFREAWRKAGKKLDMGKACIRFKRLDDLPLDVIGEVIAKLSAKAYIATYEANLAKSRTTKKCRPTPGPEKKREPASGRRARP